jgi:uncharacterized protein (TIGR03000 family)
LAPPPAGTPSLPPTTSDGLGRSSGVVTLWVPEDARVSINGFQTRSTGTQRRYVSHGLQDGLTYKYEVRAEIVRDGKTLEETRVLYLTAGSREALAMKFNQSAAGSEKDLAVTW